MSQNTSLYQPFLNVNALTSYLKQNYEPYKYPEAEKILESKYTRKNFPNGKHLILFVGANGAGKSTLLANMYSLGLIDFPYINADIVALKEFQKETDALERTKKSVFATEFIVNNLINNGKSFCFESVFSHPGKVDMVKKAKENGYTIDVFFVETNDQNINIQRVEKRVAEGGHNVPHGKIASRAAMCKENIKNIIIYCDNIYFIDNSRNFDKKIDKENKIKEGSSPCY